MKLENSQVFLSLIRIGIGHASYNILLDQLENKAFAIDWIQIKNLAEEQGLSAIVLDGIEKMPEQMMPPQILLLEWIGEVLQEYESRYQAYEKSIGEMARFYNSHGFKMMIIKGYACSKDWPKPDHRPCGDIDIWQFGKQKEADATIEAEKPVQVIEGGQNFKVDRSHHHHTVFNWGEFMVENHYDFVNVHANRTNAQLEVIFNELGNDDSNFTKLHGEKVYLPSPNLHALFLLRHAIIEFAATDISLRQLLDWAFFVEKHGRDVDWHWLENVLDKYGMKELYGVFNAICVEDLGFKSNIFNYVQFNPSTKDRVLREILYPQYDKTKAHDSVTISRIIFKFKRWKGNAWKRQLCSNDSSWSTFWNSVWGHVLKPASI